MIVHFLSANFSDILELRDAKVVIKVGDEEGSWDDIVEGKESHACLRLEIHLVNSKSALIYLTFIPISLEEMKERSEKWEVDIHSDRWPMAIMSTGTGQSSKRGAIQAKLMVVEALEVGGNINNKGSMSSASCLST